MLKRGDIGQISDGGKGFVFVVEKIADNGIHVNYLDGSADGLFDKDAHEIKPYTGPVYEKDDQRFVPSGDEVWVAPMGNPVKCEVLLPVPELEPEITIGDRFEFEEQTYVWKGECRPVKGGDVFVRLEGERHNTEGKTYTRRAEAHNTTIEDYILEPEHGFKVGD